jgi:hypothetical protein
MSGQNLTQLYTENDNFHGFSDIDVEDGLGFLG